MDETQIQEARENQKTQFLMSHFDVLVRREANKSMTTVTGA